MTTVIVLAVHGAPPRDYPAQELAEFLGLHARLEHAGNAPGASGARTAQIEDRHAALESKIRAWARTPSNDPFHAGSIRIGAELEKAAGVPVIVGFNEFCGPSLEDALNRAAALYDRAIVVTPMLTTGGGHAEAEIPKAIERARARHPRTTFMYAWPFAARDVAAFLAAQVARMEKEDH